MVQGLPPTHHKSSPNCLVMVFHTSYLPRTKACLIGPTQDLSTLTSLLESSNQGPVPCQPRDHTKSQLNSTPRPFLRTRLPASSTPHELLTSCVRALQSVPSPPVPCPLTAKVNPGSVPVATPAPTRSHQKNNPPSKTQRDIFSL